MELQHLAADAPVADIAAASNGFVRFSLSGKPVVGAPGTGERAADSADDLSSALGVRAAQVRVAPLWTRFMDDDDGWDDDHDYDDHGNDDHDREHWKHDWFTASVALGNGQWLNVAAGPPPGAPAWGVAFVAVFLLSALGIAAVAVVMGRRIAKPMRRLAVAAGHLGRGEAVEDLFEAGPAEARDTVRTFNLMRGRLDRYVRDRAATVATSAWRTSPTADCARLSRCRKPNGRP